MSEKEKYKNKSRNQPLVIQRNGVRLSFKYIKTVIGKGKWGKIRISQSSS